MVEQVLLSLSKDQGPGFLIAALVIMLILYAYRILWKEHIKQREDHLESYKETINQMFEVVNKNTEVNTRLYESVRELSHSLRRD